MDSRLLSEYFKRCFLAVDGLWFMMLEKADSFDKALDIDRKVWEVLPKIQARKIKELFKLDSGPEDLARALQFKLEAEDFVSELRNQDSGIEIVIHQCPWLGLLRRSNREHLAKEISDAICTMEYEVFAREFLQEVDFTMKSRRCYGDAVCAFALAWPSGRPC